MIVERATFLESAPGMIASGGQSEELEDIPESENLPGLID